MLNISQLNYFIDSLSQSINNRRQNQATNYRRNFLFFAQVDTALMAVTDTSLIISPGLIENFSGNDRVGIIANALSSARNTKKTLDGQVQTLNSSKEYLIKHKIVWHRKFTLSFACLVLFFIGAPLGAIIRKGGLGLPAVISILFFILYHIISMIGEKSALKGAMEVTNGMWLSSVILLPLGFFLTLKATTDSPIMDMDVWNKAFRIVNPARFFPRLRSEPGQVTGKNQ
jgi:lipopolysaccharide export system permease protein